MTPGTAAPATQAGPEYVDHPAPSVVFQIMLGAVMVAMLASIPAAIQEASGPSPSFVPLGLAVIFSVILGFYFWPLHATYYSLGPAGLRVRWGPWRREYSWDDFRAVRWRKGLFATRIGWPTVTPCVRLTNAVILRRSTGWFDLYLTPRDPEALLRKLSEVAPTLTREGIV